MKKSILKNAMFKFILNLFNLVVPILIGPYILRVVGADVNGTIKYSQTIFAYFFIFAGFGVYQYGLREISKVRDDKEKLSSVFTSLFVFTVATNVITTGIYLIYIMSNFMNNSELYGALIILTFNLLSNVFYTEWVNEAMENYGFITIKTIIIKVAYIIGLLTLVKSSNNLKEYMILLILSTFLNNIVSFIYVKRKINFNFKNINIIRHIKPMFLVVILSNANILYTQLDRTMIGSMGTPQDMLNVSYYATAQDISNMINALLLTLIYVTIPRLTNYSAKEEKKGEYLSLLNKISKMYLMVLFPAAIGMFMLSREIILLYGGQEYIMATSMLQVFSIYIITLGYESILSNQVMYIQGKERVQVGVVFIGGATNLILNILLMITGNFTVTTSIVTTMVANIIVIAIEYIYIRTKLKIPIKIFAMDKTKYLIYSLVFIPIIMFLKTLGLGNILLCLVAMMSCAITYLIILIITKDEFLLEFISKGKSFLNRKKVTK